MSPSSTTDPAHPTADTAPVPADLVSTDPLGPVGDNRPWWRRLTTPATGPPREAAPVALREGQRACHACGVAVSVAASPVPVFNVEVHQVIGGGPPLPPDPRTGQRRALLNVGVATCERCAGRQQQAAALLAPAGWSHDPRALARAQVALDALAVLGQPVPGNLTPTVLRVLLKHLGPTSADDGTWSVRWMARFLDQPVDPADAKRCAPSPWAHVPEFARAALRKRFATVLAERLAAVAPPAALTPPRADTEDAHGAEPINRGCLLCGLGAVMVPATEVVARGGREAAAEHYWRPLRAETRALGGVGSPRGIAGHVCPPCADAVDQAGSAGLTACERALRAHLVATGQDAAAAWVREGETRGLMAWGALVHRQRAQRWRSQSPGAEPWQHVNVRTRAGAAERQEA